jgi:hypothetical protein
MPPPLTLEPGAQEKLKVSTLSASDLLALIANKTSSFDFFAFVNGMQVMNNVGDPLVITGSSARDGYLYLFLIHDQTGDVKLLFPMADKDGKLQDNRVYGGKSFEFGGDKDKTGARFTADVVGPQRIKALVTSRPLTLTGLNMSSYQGSERSEPNAPEDKPRPPENKPRGQSQDFSWHPTQQEQFKEIVKAIAKGEKKLEWVQENTGVAPKKLLGEFAQAEPAFFVQGGGKPGPDKQGTDKLKDKRR